MKALSLRFSDNTHGLITEEARVEGISTSAFIREASLARAIYLKARRGAYDDEALDELYERIRDLLDADDGRRRIIS